VSDRLAELRCAGVDEYAGFPFGGSPEDGARTRALLRELDSTE
jgi:5,10-methylenetetrahydromethanopterin reductase